VILSPTRLTRGRRRRWWLRQPARCRISRPCEGFLLSPGDALDVDEFLDEFLQRVVVELKLSPHHAQ
jgi:hypothetical protein